MNVEDAYPLKRYFWQRIVPGMVAFILMVGALTVFGARHLATTLYGEAALRRADVIARAVSETAPVGWQRIVIDHLRPEDVDPAVYAQLRDELDHEVEELGLAKLKVYNPGGRILYATGEAPSNAVETGAPLRQAVATLEPQLVHKPDGPVPQYEIYVPLQGETGELLAVFEMYEPTERLNEVLRRAAGPALVPAGLFVLLIGALGVTVSKAQQHIGERTRQVAELTRRLQSFVSDSAMDAARGGAGTDIPSERVRLTLFYSDARDFTGYSENNPPERVVWFLNELMSIQVRAVREFGGDVDKMIGDALLARFKGDDAPARAVSAARAVQRELTTAALPRPVGIGIFTGDVISGAVGAEDRRDFTVIGDGVNVAARLCSAAQGGEIVVDADTLAQADDTGFDAEDTLTVKGRAEGVRVHRLTV